MNEPGQARVVSLGFHQDPWARVVKQVDEEGMRGADLIVLPETCNDQSRDQPETLDGPTVAIMAELACRHNVYIVCPIDRQQDGFRLNSAVLLDRKGDIVYVYDKVYPYWSEFDANPPVDVVNSVPQVVETDFGRLGIAICFDVNFPDVWQALATGGADLVVWPSAYSAGRALQAHALNHHYYILTSTFTRDCIVYDITGEEILYEKSEGLHVTRTVLDLDRGIYHENFNIEKRDQLLADHSDTIEMEQWLEREQWFVLRSPDPDVSARALAREYGLEELRDYKARSCRQLHEMRVEGPEPVPSLNAMMV
jgi:predicted amidohydrolase